MVLAQPTTTVNTFAGNVLVNSGALQLLGPAANQFIPDASNVTVAPGAALRLSLTPARNGAETINNLNGAGTVTAQDGSATDVFTLTVGAAGGTGTFYGALQDSATGALALAKAGAGTQTLTGANTYSGGTVISGGTLLVNNTSGSGLGTGAVTVASGATLGGTGAFSGAVAVTGKLAPGPVTAILRTGSLSFGSGGELALDLSGTTPGTGHDQVAVTGTVDLTGAALTVLTPTAFNVGDSFISSPTTAPPTRSAARSPRARRSPRAVRLLDQLRRGRRQRRRAHGRHDHQRPAGEHRPGRPADRGRRRDAARDRRVGRRPGRGAAPIVVTLSVLQGTLTTTATPGVAAMGTGSDQLTLTGSISDLNVRSPRSSTIRTPTTTVPTP